VHMAGDPFLLFFSLSKHTTNRRRSGRLSPVAAKNFPERRLTEDGLQRR
jgi:hypothetical protein